MTAGPGGRHQAALACDNLTKRFGGLEAVKDVTLEVTAGERRAIIGPNGAGKTTFFSLISGLHTATEGTIHLLGNDITNLPSHKRTALGLGRTFQITNLFPTLSVMENLVVATMGLRSLKFSMLKPASRYHDLYELAERVLVSVGMVEKSKVLVKNLSYGEQRQVEISLALVSKPRVLLLDEPTAGLSPAESATMTELIHTLDKDITILIIEHDMDVALQVAKTITVFHEGKVFEEGDTDTIRGSERVQEIYFGTEE
jgi:branched-chain amino acid transport system ATP-binding protein